jgi:hypothetical protein
VFPTFGNPGLTRPPPFTKGGREFYEVASMLQKSLRRGDVVLAARAVDEQPLWLGN